MSVHIRRATSEDIGTLALVGAATLLDAFAGVLKGKDIVAHCTRQHAASVYEKYLAGPEAAVWLAELEAGDAPIGYAMLTKPELPEVSPGADDLEVKRIYVLSAFTAQAWGPS